VKIGLPTTKDSATFTITYKAANTAVKAKSRLSNLTFTPPTPGFLKAAERVEVHLPALGLSKFSWFSVSFIVFVSQEIGHFVDSETEEKKRAEMILRQSAELRA
jgi:hypothetical protein